MTGSRTKSKEKVLFFDGATGTMLSDACKGGSLPEILNITDPDLLTDIHRKYVSAGSDIITANTFGANSLKLKGSGYEPEEIIEAAIRNARSAAPRYVALDIGPLGQFLEPAGTFSFDDAVELFARQVRAGAKYGADIIIVETMFDLLEIKAAVSAAKENCGLPVFASMTFEKNNRTLMGCDALAAVEFLNGTGADVIGVNCSQNPFDIAPIVDIFLKHSAAPVLVMPNAGLPVVSGSGKISYGVTPEQFADALKGYYEKGVSVLGGCCGTTPEHIAALTRALSCQ